MPSDVHAVTCLLSRIALGWWTALPFLIENASYSCHSQLIVLPVTTQRGKKFLVFSEIFTMSTASHVCYYC